MLDAALILLGGFAFAMKRVSGHGTEIREQAKNGLRLGLGMGAFLIALMLLSSGLRRVVWAMPPDHAVVGRDGLGWAEIGAAVVVMLLTADIWFLLLGGWAVFAFLKSVVVLYTGRTLRAPHAAFPRAEAAAVSAVALLTLALMVRFANSRPTVFDRVAFTFYVVALLWHGNVAEFSLAGSAIGLGMLAASWCAHRFKPNKPNLPANANSP